MNLLHVTPIVQTLAWSLLHFIWQGCALAAAFWTILLILRRSSASTRYLAGCITLAMMALAPIATFVWLWQRQQSLSEMRLHWGDVAANGSIATAPGVDRLSLIVVAIWLLGTALCILWLAGGWIQTRRLRGLPALALDCDMQARIDQLASVLGIRCMVRIVDHAMVAAPLTFGAIRPVILLPAAMLSGLTLLQLEAIIAHEMAHIRRMDFLVNLLQAALEALLFYHPAVWWVSRQVRIEREYCCDDLAAEVCGSPVTYARALAQLESLRSDAPRLGLSSQGGSLMKRIARLIDATSLPRSPSRLAGAAWGSTLAALAATSTALALQSPPETLSPVVPPQTVEFIEEVAPEYDPAISLAWFALARQQAEPTEVAATRSWLGAETPLWAYTLQEPQQEAKIVEGEEYLWQPAIALEVVPRVTATYEIRLDLAPQQAIDPEHMPSDGLVQAAKMTYPFNLLELMPWVAPEAHDVLIKPAVEPRQQALTYLRLLAGRQAAVAGEAEVKVLSEVPLVSRIYNATQATDRLRYLRYLTAAQQAAAEAEAQAQPQPAEEAAPVVTYEIKVIPTVQRHSLELIFKSLAESTAQPAPTGTDEAKPDETKPEPAPTPTPSQPSQPKP